MNVALTGCADNRKPSVGERRQYSRSRDKWIVALAGLMLTCASLTMGQTAIGPIQAANVPPRVKQARNFLAQRGWGAGHAGAQRMGRGRAATATIGRDAAITTNLRTTHDATTATASWQPLGPAAVTTASYGSVTGRVSSIAFDPADATGNRIYLGTTGGGVWVSQNAATGDLATVRFAPLTDRIAALAGARDSSISIGAITVQPGTGVILAGTGDPNDALDSYYGAGILRSEDGGNSWALISTTSDKTLAFTGEGFAGFAWSTINPQLVVAAVSQAFEGVLVNAVRSGVSYEGLYYSIDSGKSWSLARISDGSGGDVQGENLLFAAPDGNAATSVVWNPVRHLFIAAVRYHGYYQSLDGVTWTRIPAQPGVNLTTRLCPTNAGAIGSVACPIFRGTLAVNPFTGDTFAWSIDQNNQDQGIWQDACAISGGACSSQIINFSKRWSTTKLESNTAQGAATIANGDYDLALSAVPSGQDTLLLAGATDLWKCSLATSCAWRDTTNANSCMSAQVAPYQHALAWNPWNPLEIFVGNDSGLWRSTDALGETGPACAATDAAHFQNLNGGLGSLAEVVSMSQVVSSPYTMIVGLGANGTAGVKSTSTLTENWPQILGGEGGPVAIDPLNPSNWYVNNQAGVSIHRCAQTGDCTPNGFGVTPLIGDADVGGDGYTMTAPAPFIVDTLDPTQLLVGTCRVWRGKTDGTAWNNANAISPMLDGITGNAYCNGDALIRTMGALPLLGGGEVIYVGMNGPADGGANLAGHVLKGTYNPQNASMPVWQDLTLNPVTNDSQGMNYYGLDISSIFVDPHDATGNTVYVTIEGIANPLQDVGVAYRSIDGGAHWTYIASNLTGSPANSLVIDPLDANTAYIATDVGVFATRRVATCGNPASNCWAAYGTGLPQAPVVQLSAAATTALPNVLAAGTYGRGVWQIPMFTSGLQITTAAISPAALTFASQPQGTASTPQAVTITNTGGIALGITGIQPSADFSETDDCLLAAVNTNAYCTMQVTFSPTAMGDRQGQFIINGNVAGGQITVALDGTGTAAPVVNLRPGTLSFGLVEVGKTSAASQITAENGTLTASPITSLTVSLPFVLASNECGTSLAAKSNCALSIEFAPTQVGHFSSMLTLIDGAGTQTVALTGIGGAAPTDTLAPAALSFPGTGTGQLSTAQNIALTNDGDVPLENISAAVSPGFQVSNNCGTQLAARSNCSIIVVFAPTQTGSQTGKLTITDALLTQVVPLSGIGLLPPVLAVSPSLLSFSAQPTGTASAPVTLTVSNTGGAPMANVGFQIAGQSAARFSVGTTTCGAILTSGSNCTVQVIFTPIAAGGNAATLTITSSTFAVAAIQVPLSGAGQVASGINVNPGQMFFNAATIGQVSAAQVATVTNTSNGTATGIALVFSTPFSLIQNTCGASLGAGATCTAGVVFTPTANGVVTGSLAIASALSVNPATVLLTGTGGAAGSIQLQPAFLNFATTGIGAVSGTQTVTVTNSSATASLTDLSLAASSGFVLTSTTCQPTLASGASCTAAIAFAPTVAGQASGTLTVASSMLAKSAQVTLGGMGLDFTATVVGGTNQTVTSGQTALYVVALAPLGGSAATFTLQCGTLPAHAICSFNPSTVAVAANLTSNVTVQIATGQTATSARLSRVAGWRIAPLACGLVLLPLLRRKRRRALLMVVIAMILGGMTSCAGAGGGSGSSTPPPGASNTPAGTYSIPVTITASGVSHKLTLSMTVD